MMSEIEIVKICQYKRRLWFPNYHFIFLKSRHQKKLVFRHHIDSEDFTARRKKFFREGFRYTSAYISH